LIARSSEFVQASPKAQPSRPPDGETALDLPDPAL